MLHRQRYAALQINLLRRHVCGSTLMVPKDDLPAAAYKPEIVERGRYEKWEKNHLFEVESRNDKPYFSMVLPPPNVTGKLHLGHALACTIQDVIVRRKRAMGHNVLWLPGTDHAGISTQTVVEKYLKSTRNLDRHNLTREKFNTEVWKWTEKHGNTINDQLKLLGCSLDWSRHVFTLSPKHTRAVNAAFINLFDKGLIYRKKTLVNWCHALKSTVSDIEVEEKYIKGPTDIELPSYDKPVKFGQLYNFAYKIFGTDEEIIVSTTMPETMMGDTAIAVHPNDVRYAHLLGKSASHPFGKRIIPIIFDGFVDREFGTGAVKITPAHSKIDYEIAKKHKLPLLQVISEDGRMMNSYKFDKLKRYECREVLIRLLDNLGLLKAVRSHEMKLPICSRTGDVIDYLPKEQWFVSCSKLNQKALEVVERGILKIEPSKYINNWVNWVKDDRDWCISRQLWWGHRIPAYKCTAGDDIAWIAATDEDTAKIKASRYLRKMSDEITPERDTDVLDTWFSSGIYPFAALGWPDCYHNVDLKQFYPLSLMTTGHDILGFWIHRMVILGLEITATLPFDTILLHGIICDDKGVKMSKSKGNVIDPIDVINGISMHKLNQKTTDMHKNGVLSKEELTKALAFHKSSFTKTNGIIECGVDALRFTLLSQDIKSNYVNFDVSMCHSNKLFCNKIWQSIKYLQLSFAKLKPTDNKISLKDLTLFDKWILSRLVEMIKTVNVSMEMYDFHLATKALRTLIYNEFCDVYLEATKPGFINDDVKVGYAHAHTLSLVLNTALRCLNPFMVYMTEELIPKIPCFQDNIIHNFNDLENRYYDFPHYDHFKVWKNEHLENQIEKILNVIGMVRELKGLYGLSDRVKPHVKVLTTDRSLVCDLKEHKQIVLNSTKCSRIGFDDDYNRNYVRGFLDNETEVNVEVVGDDFVNTMISARERIQKQIKNLEDSLTKLEEKFSNKHYMTSVPEGIQILDKEKISTKKKQLKHLQRLIK